MSLSSFRNSMFSPLAACMLFCAAACADSPNNRSAVSEPLASALVAAGASAAAPTSSGTGEEGDPCETDADCVEGGLCYEGICYVATPTEPTVCAGAEDCPNGWECDLATARCVAPARTGELGSHCGSLDPCNGELVCKMARCVEPTPLGEIGEACGGDNYCASGLLCDQGTCAERWENYCQTDEECSSGLQCLQRRCIGGPGEGELGATCNSHPQCVDGLECREHECQLPVDGN